MQRRSASRGFTLIELMVVVAILGTLVLLVAPSFRDMILMQRLRGVNSQVTTDLQFARSEAVARSRIARVTMGSDANQTCYVIYLASTSAQRCNCLLGAGAACPVDPAYTEIRTVSVPRSGGVTLAWPTAQSTSFGYSHVTGGLVSLPTDSDPAGLGQVQIDARIDDDRRLRNVVTQTGRPTVCAPNPVRMQVTGCS